jgi:hypothetical protein
MSSIDAEINGENFGEVEKDGTEDIDLGIRGNWQKKVCYENPDNHHQRYHEAVFYRYFHNSEW